MFHKNDKHSKLNNKHTVRFQALAGAIGLSLFATVTSLLFFYKPKGAEAAWWDSGWRYRKRISLEYTGSENLQNYQVFLNDIDTSTLATQGKLQTDCDDLRFAGADGVQYDYWIESGCNTSTTDIWVEVLNLNSPGKEIYMYYGNVSAPIGSNGDYTFQYFNDYTGTTIDTTKIDYGGGTITQNNELSLVNDAADSWDTYVYTDNTFERDKVFYARFKANSGARAMIGWHDSGTGASYTNLVYAIYFDAGNFYIYEDGSNRGDTTIDYTTGTWYDIKIELKPTGAEYYYKTLTASTWTSLYSSTYSSEGTLRPGMVHYDITEYSYTDNWFVTQYDSSVTAPTVNSPNTEEVSKEPILHLSFDEGYGTTTYNNSGTQAPRDYIGYWKMDETSGTTVYDQTQNNNDGTSSATIATGKIGMGRDFTTSTNISIPAAALSTINSQITISFWQYGDPAVMPVNSNVFYGTDVNGYRVLNSHLPYGSGVVYWDAGNSGTSSYDRISKAATTSEYEGQWNHWVFVKNADTGEMKMYLNGALWHSGTGFTRTMSGITSFSIATIYDGILDDFKVYNYELQPEQIAALYLESNGMMINMAESDWVQGVEGTALDFDGSDDQVNFGNQASFQITGNQTYEFWINPTNFSARRNPIAKAYGGEGTITIETGATMNYYYGTAGGNTTPYQSFNSSATLTAGVWQHVALVRDFTNSKLYWYINGEKTNEATTSYTSATASSLPLLVGDGYTNNILGQMDEVKIYPYARTASEIKADYNAYKNKTGTAVGIGGKNSNQSSSEKPVLWYDFNDETGTSIYDRSGTGNHGLMTNMDSATDWMQGKYGKSLDFDGTDDYVTKGSPVSMDLSTFSIFAWVNPSLITGDARTIIQHGDDNTNANWNFLFNIQSGGTLALDGKSTAVYSSGTVPLNTWTHVGVIVSGTSASFYINGELDVTRTITAVSGFETPTGVYIGRRKLTSSYDDPFSGKIDEVKVYNYARTLSQIHEDMNGSPIAYWKFDEGYGTTAYDSMGNINGTLTNMDASTDWVNGKYGKALDFDGSNDYVDLTFPASSTTLGETGTVSFWLNMPSAQSNKGLLGFNSNNPLLYHGAGGIQTYNAGAADYSTCQATITYAQYNFITITWDNNVLDIYVNGILGCHDAAWETTFSRAAGSLKIGSYAAGTSNILGQIDEVKIYNYALTVDQIKAEYNAPYGNPTFDGTSVRYGTQGPDDPAGSNLGFTMPNPIAYWNFEEDTGTTVNDISNNGNTGTMTNMESTDWTQGKYGNALVFDGSNEYVTVPDSTTLDITGSLSISTWIKSTAFAATDVILGKRDVSVAEGNYVLRTSSSAADELEFLYENSGVWQIYQTSNANLANNLWYNIVVTTNGSSLPKIYKNGILLTGSCVNGTCTVALEADDNTFAIGRSGDYASQYFLGTIDDVKMFNTVLTPAQVAWEYNHGKPIFQMKMDQSEFYDCDGSGAGTATVCESMNEFHGTANGSMTDSDWVNGKYGNSLDFDGSNDYVGTSLYAPIPITISAWINISSYPVGSSPNTSGFIARAGNAIYFYITNTGILRFNMYNSGGNALSSTYTLSLNTWYHVVATWDGTTNSGSQKIYIDGILNNSNAAYSTTYTSPNYSFTIGAQDTTYNHFTGKIDDARIYNYARTAEQVKQDYLNGAGQRFGD